MKPFLAGVLRDDSVDKQSIVRFVALVAFLLAFVAIATYAVKGGQSFYKAASMCFDVGMVALGIGAGKSALIRGADAFRSSPPTPKPTPPPPVTKQPVDGPSGSRSEGGRP